MLAHFPRAQAYLRGASVRVDAPGMNDYWCAVMVAEMAFTDEELAEDGRVRFLPKVAENDGTALLGFLDDLLRHRTATMPKEEMDSLRAFIGSRGVKAGKLKATSDFWRVAEILWPGLVKRTKNADLRDLLYQLRKLGKKQRASAQKHRHLTGEIPQVMQSVIDQLPADRQFAATMLIAGGTEFLRDNDLVSVFGASQGMNAAQIDDFWRFAQGL